MTRLLPLLAIMALFLGLVSVAHAQATTVSFDSAPYTREIDENTGADQDVGSPVTASDTQSDALTYTLGGAAAASFEIVSTSGQIQTKAGVTYDHEAKSNYTVTVTASDGKGGTATATVTITINDLDEPPLAPDQPIAVAVPRTYRQISVRWFPPENSGRPEITGYDVQYEDYDFEIADFVWLDWPQHVAGTSAIISNLDHSASYNFRVRAKNNEGDGPWSPVENSNTHFPPYEFELGDVRIPSGLGPGDSFRMLFVTRIERSDDQGDFLATNDRINDYRNLLIFAATVDPYFPALFSLTILPLVSIPHVDARVATNTTWTDSDRGVPIYWVGGSKVADDYADFYDGDWDDETNVRDQRGRLYTVPPVVWTGSAHDGTELMVNGVSHALGQPQAGYGIPGSTVSGAGPLYSGSTADSTVLHPLYGLTSVYRVVNPGLVSNLAQRGSTEDDRSARRSQRFTTGAHLHGYELSGIQVGYVYDRERSFDFSISLHAVDTDGDPGAKVADFTYPDGDNESELTFESPASITLDPGTTYAVVVSPGTAGTDIKLRATTSNREDNESEDGWSIEDAFDIQSGSSWAADTDGRSLKIRIRGTPKVGPPAKPTGLSANAMGRDRINLSWTAPSMDGGSAITGYRIESSADGSTGWTDVVADTGTTTTSYSHTGLHANTTLYYRVSAINVEGTSGASDTANATTDDDPQVTVSFGAATYTAAEGGTATVTVTLSADPERTVEVPITTTNEGGASAADYSGVPATVTFDAGDTSKTFTFTAAQDTDDDDGESVKLGFGSSLPAGVSEGSPSETTVSITDDDDPQVTVSFGAATYRAIEGSTAAVTVELSADPERTVAVPITKTNERGVSDSDYSGVPASITFNSGDTEKTITFTATADSLNESGERVKLSFGTLPTRVSEGTPAETTVTISDSTQAQTTLPTIHFGSASYTVSEGGSVDVTVTLSKAPGSEAVIPLTASNQGGATASDYSGVPTSVTFGAAETSRTFTVTAAQDTADDDGESILLGFGTLPGGITATTGQAAATTVSIRDDDDPQVTVSFGASTYTAAEGSTATVTVTLSADPERTVAIPLTKTNQGGASAADYSGVPATVTFNAGETSKTFDFAAAQDTEDDDGESVKLAFGTSLPAGVSAGSPSKTTVSITDDDDPQVTVSFGAATYTAAEGGTATVTLTLSADPERTVEVRITATNQGGATSVDYSGVPASVTFDAGDTSQTFDFAATQDTLDDDGESVKLAFGTLPTGVSAGATDETSVSIRDDDDPQVTVSFGASTYTAAEGGTATVTLTLSADPERTVAIPVTTTNQGGATSADYSGVPASVTFDAGDTSKTFTFTAAQDTLDDDGESVKLAFGTSLPAGVSAGSPSETTVSITDDDDPQVTVSFGAATYTAAEGGTATVTLTLSADPERTVEVRITATNQGGATSADYSGVPASVSFTAGQTSKTITFTATQDAEDDDGESVKLAFGALPAGVRAGATDETTVSITDDDDPQVTVSFGASTYTAAEGGTATVTVTLSADPERTVAIPVTTTNQGGATSADYSGVPVSVTFDAGDTSQPITFAATQDTVDDDGESVLLGFGSLPAGVRAGATDETTVSIRDDDDPQVTVSFGAATYRAIEGGTANVTVELSADPERTVEVPITTTNQGGASASDYSGVPASITFNSGDTEKTITFTAVQDSLNESGERVKLSFGTLPARVSEGTPDETTVSISDSVQGQRTPPTVHFGAATYTVAEGGGVAVAVTLSKAPGSEAVIPITKANRGGASSADYSGVPATVTFDAGDTSKTFTFTAAQDTADDDGESVLLGFGTLPGGITATTSEAAETTVSITDDDDPQVTVSFQQNSYKVEEGKEVVVTVSLSADPERSVTIPLTKTDQDGASDADYSGVPSSLTFNSGETSKSFAFTAAADEDDEGDESVKLAFGSLPAGYGAGTRATATVTLTNNNPGLFNGALRLVDGVTFTEDGRPCDGRVEIYYNGAWGTICDDYWGRAEVNVACRSLGFVGGAAGPQAVLGEPDVYFGRWDEFDRYFDTGICPEEACGAVTDEGVFREAYFGQGAGEIVLDNVQCNGNEWGLLECPRNEGEHNCRPFEAAGMRCLKETLPRIVYAQVSDPPGDNERYDEGETVEITLVWSVPVVVTTPSGALPPKVWLSSRNYSGIADYVRGSGSTHTVFSHTLSRGSYEEIRVDGDSLRERDGRIRSANVGLPAILKFRGYPEILDGAVPAKTLTPPQFSNPGSIAAYGTDDTVEVTFNFDLPVRVDVTDGTPSVAIHLGGTAERQAEYLRGSGSNQIVFAYTLTGSDEQHDAILVQPNSLVLNGGSMRDVYFENDVELEHPSGAQVLPIEGLSPAGQNAPQNSPAEGAPRIGGNSAVGETLSVDTTGITDADGLNHAVFEYQWLADDAEIEGASGSTYTPTSADEGKTITVRVTFTDDAGNEESLTSAATAAVAVAGLELRSATLDGATLTLTYNETLDSSVTLPATAFTVSLNGGSRSVSAVSVSGSAVTLTLASEAAAGDTVTVDYTRPEGRHFIRDTRGRVAPSFSGRVVSNDTAPDQPEESEEQAEPLTASAHDVPASHDGSAAFTFELRFSETPKDGFSYRTLRDHAFTVTGAEVVNARRLESGKNVRWRITVEPSGNADVTLSLPATTDCSGQGAICAGDGRKLSSALEITVSGPETSSQQSQQQNSAATGAPTITGTAQVGEALTANTTGIADSDGLTSATFTYQWLADDADISGATSSSYTPVAADAGKAIKVQVSFTDDQGHAESLTSAATSAVRAAVTLPPLTASAHDVPESHDGSAAFTFELRFSETPKDGFSYASLRDHAFTVTGAEVAKARRLERGKNVRWEITVEPSGNADVSIILPATSNCGGGGAICTQDGRVLSNRLVIIVSGSGG